MTAIRKMKYQKNGYDIMARVHGTGEYAEALILWKFYGDDTYTPIGKIYKTTTAACGTTRDTATWHHKFGESPMYKKSWHEAAGDLASEFLKKEIA